jgi:radical SAM protein with 4Fe4S-binding SPASM domain
MSKNLLSVRKQKTRETDYSLTPDFPKEILIDISSLCNHTCLFCSNVKMKNKSHAKSDLVYKVLREARNEGTDAVGLFATGEPFLNKDLENFIQYAKKIGYTYIFVTTNGAAVTKTRIESAINNGLDSIKFSIHAGTRETYKKIHGKDDFERVIKNLKFVDEFRKKNKKELKIYVSMVETFINSKEIEKLKNIVEPYIDEWDLKKMINSCGTMPENYLIGKVEENNIRGRGHHGVCFQPFTSFTITPEGFLSGCVLDYHKALIIGDCNKQSLKEIWHSNLYQDWRNRHLNNRTLGSICYNCIHNTNKPYDSLIPGTLEKPLEK